MGILGAITALGPLIAWIMKLIGFSDDQVKDMLKRISNWQSRPVDSSTSEEAQALAKLEAMNKKGGDINGKKENS